MVINMNKMNYNNIIANITNTINTPVKIEKKKSDVLIYTFYLTIAILVITQLLFLDKFTYFTEFFVLKNGINVNTFTITIFSAILSICIGILFLKPHIINKILYIISFIVIALFSLNYVLDIALLDQVLYLPTIIICGIFLGFLTNSSVFMILYSLGTKQKINVLLSAFATVCLFIVVRHFIYDVSKSFGDFILPLISMLILLFVMSFLGKDYFKKIEMTGEYVPISSVVFFIILFFFYVLNALAFYIICKSRIIIFDNYNLLIFCSGILLSIIVSCLIFQYSKVFNIIYIFLWLIFSIIAFQFLYLSSTITTAFEIIVMLIIGITLGFGFIANYMILGACLQDKSSLGLIRLSIIVIVLILSLALAIKELFYSIDVKLLTVISQSVIFLFNCFLVFTLIRMILINVRNEIKSSKEDSEEEVIIDTKYPNPYELLTNKEVIVFEQLLLGNTLRQIAGELHMKYDTVNFHYKNIYRKLEVNSRIELIVRYGKKVR